MTWVSRLLQKMKDFRRFSSPQRGSDSRDWHIHSTPRPEGYLHDMVLHSTHLRCRVAGCRWNIACAEMSFFVVAETINTQDAALVFAFYGRSKPLLALLCFLFVAGRTLNIIGPILANLKSQKLPAHPKIHFRACFVTKSNNAWSMPFWYVLVWYLYIFLNQF